MSTTLRLELTNAGCNVATATIVFQNGVGKAPEVGRQHVNPSAYGGQSTTGGTDSRLDKPFAIRQDTQLPRCIAIDANNIYVWDVAASRRPRFTAIPIVATAYTTGNALIPILGGT